MEDSPILGKATINDIPKLNKMLLKLKQDSVTIKYTKLGRIDELKLSVFSDVGYDNLPDVESSGIGFVIFLSVGFNPGKVSPCPLLSWTACKVQKKIPSTCAAEALSLLAEFEQEMIENKDVESVTLIPACRLFNKAGSFNQKSSSYHHHRNVPINIIFLEEED